MSVSEWTPINNQSQRKSHHLLTTRVIKNLTNRGSERISGNYNRKVATKSFAKWNSFVGRELQLQTLGTIFHRIGDSHASEAVMIHGPSGVGKSTLVDAFVKTLPKSTLIARGKFDQLHCRTPFSTLVAITEHLCRQILRHQNHEEIRDRIRGTLGSELSLLGQLIPELANIITEKHRFDGAPRSQNTSSYNRFTQLLRCFLRCVASEDNPVILFFDDIQWADIASIEILESLLTDNLSRSTMIICAYRDGEACGSFSKILNLSEGKSENDGEYFVWPISIFPVEKLDKANFNELISKTLHLDENETESLSLLIWNKTDGNPFFASNFLDMLYSREMLSQEIDGRWNWDETRILLQTNVAENLAHILEVKLQRLPSQARSILQMASFIGYEFSLDVLAIILFEEQDIIEVEYSFDRHSMESIQNQISFALMLACDEGLLETISDSRKKAYKFAHDKIRQVLYEDLMPDTVERQLLHQRIGFLVWEAITTKQKFQANNDWAVYLAANNLNCALSIIENLDTINKTVNINLMAGKAAMAKSDFRLALEYLRVAVKLLDENPCWESQYALCINLYSTAAEVEMISACYDRCDYLLAELFQRAKSLEDQFTAYQVQLYCLAGKGEIKASVYLGFDILRKLGLLLPQKITAMSVAKEFLLAKVALGMKPLVHFLTLPELTDQKIVFMLSIMDEIVTNSFVLGDSFKEVCAFFIFRMFRMTLRYGISAMYAPTTILSWGTSHAFIGVVDTALEAKQVAFMVIEKFKAEAIKGQAILVASSSIDIWRDSLNNDRCQEILFAYHLARAAGDIFFAQFGIVIWIMFKTYLNDPIFELHPRIRAFVGELRMENAKRALILIQPNWQFLLNLSGDKDNIEPSTLRGEAVDDGFALEVQDIDSKSAVVRLNQFEMMTAYLFGDWDLVKKGLSFMKKNEKTLTGVYPSEYTHVWTVICYYDAYLEYGDHKFKREGQRVHRKVKKWAESGTQNLVAPNLLLNAIFSLCSRRVPIDQIEFNFKASIAACAEAKCIIFEALANERFAKFLYVKESDRRKGAEYQRQAIEIYRSWGAIKKATWLENVWYTA